MASLHIGIFCRQKGQGHQRERGAHSQSHTLQSGNPRVVVVVQSLSHVQLFATPWTAALQASLSFTVSQNLLKLMSVESVMPSNHLILCRPLLLGRCKLIISLKSVSPPQSPSDIGIYSLHKVSTSGSVGDSEKETGKKSVK